MRPPDPRSREFPGPEQDPITPGETFTRQIPGRGFATTALMFAAITLIFPLAVIFGIGFASAAKRRGDPWAQPTLIGSLVCLATGIALAIIASDLGPDAFASMPQIWFG